jgi:hypothetical protein
MAIMNDANLMKVYFHCGSGRGLEREWRAVPRVGETVMNEYGIFTVAEVHWDDDDIGEPYVHVHLEPRANG